MLDRFNDTRKIPDPGHEVGPRTRLAINRQRSSEQVNRAATQGGRPLDPWWDFAERALRRHIGYVRLDGPAGKTVADRLAGMDPKLAQDAREDGYWAVSSRRADSWALLYESERLMVLQRAEWIEAAAEGLPPRLVHIVDSPDLGCYNGRHNLLTVGQHLIAGAVARIQRIYAIRDNDEYPRAGGVGDSKDCR